MSRRWRPLYHWRQGRHSNIPACCRVFFVFWRLRRRVDADLRDPDPRAEYVRCPVCMRRGRFNPLHYCGPSCPPPFTRHGPRSS